MSNASYICLNLRDICNSDIFENYKSPQGCQNTQIKIISVFFFESPPTVVLIVQYYF